MIWEITKIHSKIKNFLTALTILIKGLSVVFYLDKIYFKC